MCMQNLHMISEQGNVQSALHQWDLSCEDQIGQGGETGQGGKLKLLEIQARNKKTLIKTIVIQKERTARESSGMESTQLNNVLWMMWNSLK